MPSGELSVTLAASTLVSHAEPSGNIGYAALASASLASAGHVLLYGALATTLGGVTAAASGGVEITGALAVTLGGVSAETFGVSLNGTTAPYEDVISWTGHPLTGSLVRVRTGNLFGIFGEPNEFGLFAGEGWDASSGAVPLASSKYIRLGSFTNEFHNVPINLYDTGVITMQMEPDAPSFAMGNPLPSSYGVGIGLWQGNDGGVYKWRVGDPSGASLNWDGTGLSINNGSLDIGGVDAHLAFGNPPPTSPTSGTGIWIDRTGFYGVNAGVTQIFIDTLDGILYIDGGTEFGVNPLLGDLYVDGILTLGTDGRLQQGTGTWGVDFTGSAIWNESDVMMVGGWNNNVKQWWGGSGGSFYAGGGDVNIDANGITIYPGNKLRFVDEAGQDIVKADVFNNFWNTPTVPCLQLGSVRTTGDKSAGVVLYSRGEAEGGTQEATLENTPGKFSINLYNNIDTAGTKTQFTLMLTTTSKTHYFIMNMNYITIKTGWMALNGGLHVGGTSDPGTDNLVVDGNVKVTDYITADGGLHVGGTSDPGTDNLVVDGTIKDGSGVEYLKDISYKASAYRNNTTFTLTTSGTLYAIPLNAEEFDSHSQHDNSTNPERFTCVKAGTYLVTGQVTFAANATGNRDALLRVNGTNYVGQNRYVAMASGSTSVPVFAMVELAVDDYVELIGRQYSDGSLNLYYANSLSNHMKVIRLSS